MRALARRRVSTEFHDQFRVMDAQHGIGGNLAGRRAQEQIAAGGDCTSRPLVASAAATSPPAVLILEARLVEACESAAQLRSQSSAPTRPIGLAGAQQSPDRKRLAAHRRRANENRSAGWVSLTPRKNRRTRAAASKSTLPSDRNPAIAALAHMNWPRPSPDRSSVSAHKAPPGETPPHPPTMARTRNRLRTRNIQGRGPSCQIPGPAGFALRVLRIKVIRHRKRSGRCGSAAIAVVRRCSN